MGQRIDTARRGMFDAAFEMADEAALAVMGEEVEIAPARGSADVYVPGGNKVNAVRDEAEYFSQLGDGGFIGTRNATFYVLTKDAATAQAKAGCRVITVKDEWTVNVTRDLGTMTALLCISSSGQAAPEF